MCDDHNHHHHHHSHDRESYLQPDGGIRKPVDSPGNKEYDNPRDFVQPVTAKAFDNHEVWEAIRDPDKRVVKGKDLPFKSKTRGDRVEGSHAWGKSLVRPWKGMTQSMSVMERVLGPEADDKKHAHQNEAMMYVLEGKGYEIHDGVEYTWEAGDLIVISAGCVHSHHSADPDNPCRVIVYNSLPVANFLHLLYQGTVHNAPTEPLENDPEWTPPWNYSSGVEAYSAEDAKYNEEIEKPETEARQKLKED